MNSANTANTALGIENEKRGFSRKWRKVKPEAKKERIQPTATHEEPWPSVGWDMFQCLVEILETRPHLWPALRAYAGRVLPRDLFAALEREVQQ